MKSTFRSVVSLVLSLGVVSTFARSQTSSPGRPASDPVPALVRYSGVIKDIAGKPQTGRSGVTFALYRGQQGGAAMWIETQNVRLDATGHYTVMLGASNPNGLPSDLFSSGEARWLGVQAEGQAEQPRVLLVSVPYALKAKDAETVGGLPPSAFVLAAPPVGTSSGPGNTAIATAVPPVSGTGTTGKLVRWTNGATGALGDSNLFQDTTGNIGIGNTAPGAKLDVTGGEIVRGALRLPSIGTATAAAGKSSNPLDLQASAFHSGTAAAVPETFRWRVDPTGNDTNSPGALLNLYFGSGGVTPVATGLHISSKGLFTFVPGQTFPGTGSGTVKSVGFTAPASDFAVSGSPVTSSGTLALAWKVAPTDADTANAIVKRDATGSFHVTDILGTGTFSTNTSKGSAVFGVSTASGSIQSGAAVAVAGIEAGSGLTSGVLGENSSTSTKGSAGVEGRDENLNGSVGFTMGVVGGSHSPAGIGVLGFNAVNGTTADEFNIRAGHNRVGMWADSPEYGLVATSDLNAIVAYNKSQGATIFAENDSTASNALLFYATAPNAAGAPLCSINTHADLNCSGNASIGTLQIRGGSDLSEQFRISPPPTSPQSRIGPGMVVSIDPQRPGSLMISTVPYDRRAVGVISGAGGVEAGLLMSQSGSAADGDLPVALAGRVYCWADTSHGPIKPGDLLTTSRIPGHAAKAADRKKAEGAIIGKALTGLGGDPGLILILVTLR